VLQTIRSADEHGANRRHAEELGRHQESPGEGCVDGHELDVPRALVANARAVSSMEEALKRAFTALAVHGDPFRGGIAGLRSTLGLPSKPA
jgi:hypothetical protein